MIIVSNTRLVFYFLALLILTQEVMGQNWPQFRGPHASGIAEGNTSPVKWNAETGENIAWKVAIPGLGNASPIVWGDRIFITTAISSDLKASIRPGNYGQVDSDGDVSKQSWRIYCLDKKSGKILWERVAIEGIPKIKRHLKSTFANSTPVTDGKYVIAFFGAEGLYCYDVDGNLKWKKDLGTLDSGFFFDPTYQWGMASSPIIYKNLLILQVDVQKDSFIAGYDVKTGKQVWKTMRDEIPSWGTPTIYESKACSEVITNATRGIRGYDPLTGKELWVLRGNPEITATTPIISPELIIVANGYRPIQPIYAIKPCAKGDISPPEGVESSEFISWTKPRGGPYLPTPLVYDAHLYIFGNNGALTVYLAKTGERLYQQRVSQTSTSFSASPVAADGKLYFSSEDGEVIVVKAGEQFEVLATNPMGEIIMATPAISDGMMIIRGQKHVFAVAEKSQSASVKKTQTR